jgi:hypothetical protein
MDVPVNKKLIVGAAALTTVVIGGYVYYRWVLPKLEDEDLYDKELELAERLDAMSDDEVVEKPHG